MDRQLLFQRSVGTALPGLAEDIAFTGCEVCLVRIASRNSHGANRNKGNLEAGSLECRVRSSIRVIEGAARTGDSFLF